MDTIYCVDEKDVDKSLASIRFRRYEKNRFGYILRIKPFILFRDEKGVKIPILIESIHVDLKNLCGLDKDEFYLWSNWEYDVYFIEDKRFIQSIKNYIRLKG